MTESVMSCNFNHNSVTFNDLLRRAVKAEMKNGQNWMGATANVADKLGMHPNSVRLRYHDEIEGEPRRAGLADACWRFLAYVHDREEAWLERLGRDIEQRRNELQLTLPLEPPNGALRTHDGLRRLARAEGELAKAKKAMADLQRAKGMRK